MLETVSFHITNKCHSNCIHCMFKSGEEVINELSKDEVFDFIGQFAKLTKNAGRLNIYGGEPLIRDNIFEIMNEARNHQLKVEVATGGVVEDELMEQFLEARPDYICCDLDGGTAESHDWLRNHKGSFNRMKGLISRFVQTGISTSVTMVVNKRNMGEIIEFLELCRTLKVSSAVIYLFTPTGRGTEMQDYVVGAEEWLELHNKAYAWFDNAQPDFTLRWQIAYYKGPRTSLQNNLWDCGPEADRKFYMRCDGNVYSCSLLTGAEDHCMGNVRTESLESILERRKQFAFSSQYGCPGISHHVYGDPNAADPRAATQTIMPACPRETELWKKNIL
ncbi:radical SAM/SPASM domain-containing protein [Paenibacillus albidus]|uniref:Radical SAM/SPASM domain-containing protein n=1 Tax=Paenibacillus albidus TaxID=2041023 RepID=A0A917FVN7_9BACL|nr:radical SAM protein [Paenibacillus albidus]GGG07184.1 radical SAM/SPASM domain-containing protein [Paenibacillus albidus]